MISNDAFEKAVSATTQGKPETPATPVQEAPTPVVETAPKSEGPAAPVAETPAAPATPPADQEWDGDVNKLPPELQGWAKKAQRTLTKKAMAASEEIRLGQELKKFQESPDWQAFQQWKRQGSVAAAPTPQAPQAPTGAITQQDWEAAQLDPTGQKFQELVDRQVQAKINEAARMYGAELQQLRTTQQVTAFQQVLSDFADLHPDAVDLHNKGILKPLLEEEMKGGRHKSHEAAVNAAYERATAIRDAIKADAMNFAQARVAEKRNAVVSTGTSVSEANIAYVDKANTFDEAFNFAIQGKKVKVKAKQ